MNKVKHRKWHALKSTSYLEKPEIEEVSFNIFSFEPFTQSLTVCGGNAENLGYRLNVTLEAVDSTKTLPAWGFSHVTTVIVSSNANLDDLRDYFLTKEIKVGFNISEEYKYKTVPGSMSWKV